MTLPRLSLPVWLVLMPGLCLLYLAIPPSPDQALFDYIAWENVQGAAYYAGVAEQNWPGKMLLHEAGIRLFGVAPWTFRALDFLLLQMITGAGMLWLWRAGFSHAPLVFLLLYPALYVTAGPWMAGQRDIVAMGFLMGAAALSLPARTGRAEASWAGLACGALVFAAVLTRPTYLTFLALLMLMELGLFVTGRQTFRRACGRVALMTAGFGLPLLLTLWLGRQAGALDDFIQQTILFNIESYQVPQSRWRLLDTVIWLVTTAWHWVSLLALTGAVLWLRSRQGGRALLLWLGLFVTVLISYVVQNKGFGYHLGGWLPLLCLLVCIAFDHMIRIRAAARPAPRRHLAGAVLLGMGLLTVAGTGKKIIGTLQQSRADTTIEQQQQINEAVTVIRQNTDPADYVLQWGRIFSIPFLAERRATMRFVSTPALDAMTPAFSGYEDWLAEMQRSLTEKRPTMIIVDPAVTAHSPSGSYVPRPGAGAAERMLVAHLATYEPVMSTDRFVLFQDRRP